jgi:hypothetical protein
MVTGATLWLTYGSLKMDISIVWANAVALVFIIYMLVKKIQDVRSTR